MTEYEVVGGPRCGDIFVMDEEEVELGEGDQVQIGAESDLWFELRDGKLQIVA